MRKRWDGKLEILFAAVILFLVLAVGVCLMVMESMAR